MFTSSWPKMESRLFQLHAAEQFEEALAFLNTMEETHPDQTLWVIHYRTCLLTRLGRIPQALSLLKSALNNGVWLPPYLLRSDNDLAILQTDAEFAALLLECDKRLLEAQKQAKKGLLLYHPDMEKLPKEWFIGLHGGGDAALSFAARFQNSTLLNHFSLAIPQSEQVRGPQQFGWGDRDVAKSHMIALRHILAEHEPLTPAWLCGFSQGGRLALECAFQNLLPVRHCIAVAPALTDGIAATYHNMGVVKQTGVRFTFIIGENDWTRDKSTEIHTMLLEHGIKSELQIVPNLGHAWPDDFEQRLSKIIAENIL